MTLTIFPDFAATLAPSGPGWFGVAFALGLVHALDADHVMAVSVFATRGHGTAQGVRAGLRWSLGHGLVLLAAGLVLVAFGRSLPEPPQYLLTFNGFSRDGGLTFETAANLAEGQQTTAQIYGTLTAVPLPAAIWLMATGLLALTGFVRTKK